MWTVWNVPQQVRNLGVPFYHIGEGLRSSVHQGKPPLMCGQRFWTFDPHASHIRPTNTIHLDGGGNGDAPCSLPVLLR